VRRVFWQLITFIFLWLGCASHYYRIQADKVIFHLEMPEATSVGFASSLDEYKLHSAQKIGKADWVITLPARSEFEYFYVVDGAVYIPECEFQAKDDFGSQNCIYVPGM
jgi:hypothetical protein